jgi:hypothetical protein
MTVNVSLSRAQAQRIVPGRPFRMLCLCRGSLATWVPAKVVGLVDRIESLPDWPTDLWGDCGYRRSDRRRRRRESLQGQHIHSMEGQPSSHDAADTQMK